MGQVGDNESAVMLLDKDLPKPGWDAEASLLIQSMLIPTSERCVAHRYASPLSTTLPHNILSDYFFVKETKRFSNG
jgi:hypothetical protein